MKKDNFFCIISVILLFGTKYNFSMYKDYVGKRAISTCARFIISGTESGKVAVENICKDQAICSYRHDFNIESVSFTPDSKHIVSSSTDGVVKIWDISNKNPKQICSYKHKHLCGSCVSGNGKYVASRSSSYGNSGGQVKVWDISDINNPKQVCGYEHSGNKGWIRCICFSSNGKYIASGSDDGKVIVWDINKNKQVYFYKHNDQVWRIDFSNNGKYMAFGSDDGQVKILDISNIKKTKVVYAYKQGKSVKCLCFSNNSKHMASGSWAGEIKVYDISDAKKIKEIWNYNNNDDWHINCMCFSSNGWYMVSCSGFLGSNEVKFLDIKKEKEIYGYKHNSAVEYVCFAPDQNKLISVDIFGQAIFCRTPPLFYRDNKIYEIRKKENKCRANALKTALDKQACADCVIKTMW